MRLINADRLLKRLGMARKCEDCPNQSPIKGLCGLSVELMEVCDEIESAPVIEFGWIEAPKGCVDCFLNNDSICVLMPELGYDETNGEHRRENCPIMQAEKEDE